MPLAAPQKKAAIDKYKTHEGDTGSPEVQVALLTERITYLTEHFKKFAASVEPWLVTPRWVTR